MFQYNQTSVVPVPDTSSTSSDASIILLPKTLCRLPKAEVSSPGAALRKSLSTLPGSAQCTPSGRVRCCSFDGEHLAVAWADGTVAVLQSSQLGSPEAAASEGLESLGTAHSSSGSSSSDSGSMWRQLGNALPCNHHEIVTAVTVCQGIGLVLGAAV
jgi:hypothetical protein